MYPPVAQNPQLIQPQKPGLGVDKEMNIFFIIGMLKTPKDI